MTGTQTAPHAHSFPVQPPHGSILDPGPCECGKSYTRLMLEQRAAEAGLAVADPEDLRTAVQRLPVDGQYMQGVRDRLAAAAGVKS